MSERLAAIGENSSLGDDILDELEGEALVILEHPENHAAVTVSMARASDCAAATATGKPRPSRPEHPLPFPAPGTWRNNPASATPSEVFP
jgi:hypothetical protein